MRVNYFPNLQGHWKIEERPENYIVFNFNGGFLPTADGWKILGSALYRRTTDTHEESFDVEWDSSKNTLSIDFQNITNRLMGPQIGDLVEIIEDPGKLYGFRILKNAPFANNTIITRNSHLVAMIS